MFVPALGHGDRAQKQLLLGERFTAVLALSLKGWDDKVTWTLSSSFLVVVIVVEFFVVVIVVESVKIACSSIVNGVGFHDGDEGCWGLPTLLCPHGIRLHSGDPSWC